MLIRLNKMTTVVLVLLLSIIITTSVSAKQYSCYDYPSNDGWWSSNGFYNSNEFTGRVVSGDFDGDKKDDNAVFYNYPNSKTRIHVFLSTGSSFNYQSDDGWWQSAQYYDSDKITYRVVAGDFNGDGKDDIAAIYEYPETKARIHVFLSTGTSFEYQGDEGWWSSENYYDVSKIDNRIVSGDFNGDGYDDIAAVYEYPNNKTRIHMFLSTGTSFNYQTDNGWWKSPNFYDATKITGRVIAGDFNGDKKSDIAVLYQYPDYKSRIHVFLSTGTSLEYQTDNGWWKSPNCYDASKVTNRIVAGDYNGDGADDIAALYEYPNYRTRIHMFLSNKSSFEYQTDAGWWKSEGFYDANKITSRVVSGDYNGDGKDDISAFYEYPDNQTKIHMWTSAIKETVEKYGIDVSSYQGTIDWDTVKRSGQVDFAIIKCGYGDDYQDVPFDQDDTQFKRNISECERLGIPYGVYLYSYAKHDTDSSNTGQIQSEINHVRRLISGHHPFCVYLDMEDASTINVGKEKLTSMALQFCSALTNAGFNAGIYANTNWFTNYIDHSAIYNAGYKIWLADYRGANANTTLYRDIFQYSESGSIPGINHTVDLDIGYFK